MLPDELMELAAREQEAQQYRHQLNVCVAAGCLSCQGDKVLAALLAEVRKRGLEKEYLVKGVGCMSLCVEGPLVHLPNDDILYSRVKPQDAADIIESMTVGNKPLERLLCDNQAPFFKRQVRIVLENTGRINPEKIEDYLAAGGYMALHKALTEMSPDDVRYVVRDSGLRGRGGAGYPTGLKWGTVRKASGAQKYVVCNADEGDPGAFMDRSVLESDPHRVIEGMAIAGYSVGASQGFIYARAEYPLAVERLQKAIRQAERTELLGKNILGSQFSFSIDLRLGAGAFVCGEETALLSSVEGRRGNPRPRPPYPAESGLWGHPTLINNVETFASIAPIIRNGAHWYASIGTEKSKGTKVFALAGRVKNTGLIEVPMGYTLRDIIFDIGGGIPGGRKFKAVQTGGPSGGCIPEQFLDMPVDYESLAQVGSIMGSGGMIVMDDSSCMVDVAKFFMDFSRSESCGKCVPCRVGTVHMHQLLTKISRGQAELSDLDMLLELADMVKSTSLCGLGQSAPNPVLSALRYFKEEFMEHIVEKKCPAGVCRIERPTEVMV